MQRIDKYFSLLNFSFTRKSQMLGLVKLRTISTKLRKDRREKKVTVLDAHAGHCMLWTNTHNKRSRVAGPFYIRRCVVNMNLGAT